MRLVSINNIKPEDRLAKNIYDENGNVLLASGSQLRPEYISKLTRLGISAVYVEDDDTKAAQVDDIVTEGVRIQVKKITKEVLNKVKSGGDLELKKVQDVVNEVMDEVIRNRHMLVHLIDIRSKSDLTFSHSVNVCILSMLTGIVLGYNQLRLKELGLGALLHDVGKAFLEEKLVKGEGLSQTEKVQFQKHTDLGFQTLRKGAQVSSVVAHVAWQHHEHYDGSGYPRGLKGQEIHEFGRIVAVADFYDNLITGTAGSKRLLPHEAIEIIQSCQGKEFDPEIARLFIQNIAPYPIGSIVRLNTGSRGKVIEVKKEIPTRPKVKVLVNEKGEELLEPLIIDLVEELTVFIAEVERV